MSHKLHKPAYNVGFWFDYGLSYAGGLNYFRNLLYAVHQANPAEFNFTLFIPRDLSPVLEEEFSQYVQVVKLDILTRGTVFWLLHRIAYRGLRSQFFIERILRYYNIHILSHASMVHSLNGQFFLISWIPDFQFLHLPHLFPGLSIEQRCSDLRALHHSSDAVIVSSQNAYGDFVRVMAIERPPRTYILPFVSQIPQAESFQDSIHSLLVKYQLPNKFLFLPNQFWAHKNHYTAFMAVSILRDHGFNVFLVCTGSLSDPNGNTFSNTAVNLIEQQGLQNHVRLLGSIDYSHVLQLMRASVAVINPSHFEGWSSSVEEAKSLGKPLIASDLAVHREQSHPNALYFKPSDVSALASHIRHVWLNNPVGPSLEDEKLAKQMLHLRTLEFGNKYVNILRKTLRTSHDFNSNLDYPYHE